MKVCIDGFNKDFINKEKDMYAIALTQNILSGRWKYFILWYLKDKRRRFSDIKHYLEGIS